MALLSDGAFKVYMHVCFGISAKDMDRKTTPRIERAMRFPVQSTPDDWRVARGATRATFRNGTMWPRICRSAIEFCEIVFLVSMVATYREQSSDARNLSEWPTTRE